MQVAALLRDNPTSNRKEGIFLQEHRNRDGRRVVMLFKSITARGQCNSPELRSIEEMSQNPIWTLVFMRDLIVKHCSLSKDESETTAQYLTSLTQMMMLSWQPLRSISAANV